MFNLKPVLTSNQLLNKVIDLSMCSLGFTVTESSYNHPQFSTVQQLQDSSTLESQALSSSYHPPNLLHVSSTEVVSKIGFCCPPKFALIGVKVNFITPCSSR